MLLPSLSPVLLAKALTLKRLAFFSIAAFWIILSGCGSADEAVPPVPREVKTEASGPPAAPAATEASAPAAANTTGADSPAGPAAAAVPPAGPDFARDESGPFAISGAIDDNLYKSVAAAIGPETKGSKLLAEKLAAHFKRIFFFKLEFKTDLLKGDRFSAVFRFDSARTDGLRITTARYTSSKLGKTFEAYFFEDGAPFGAYRDADGTMVQARLKDAPISGYEEITSLLKDRRPRHNGVDFKAPTGTPVATPFTAEVIATGSDRFSGRNVKLRYLNRPWQALFLHLDAFAPGLAVGKRLAAGDPVGKVGNTGRSYAPHLHYELRSGAGAVLDPIKMHGIVFDPLAAEKKPAFQAAVTAYRLLLDKVEAEPKIALPPAQ